jgi:hypothetical protein
MNVEDGFFVQILPAINEFFFWPASEGESK